MVTGPNNINPQQGGQAIGLSSSNTISGEEYSVLEMSTGEKEIDPRRGRNRDRSESTARSRESGSASDSSRKRKIENETFKRPIPKKRHRYRKKPEEESEYIKRRKEERYRKDSRIRKKTGSKKSL